MKKSEEPSSIQITGSNIEDYALEMTTPESANIKQVVKSSEAELEFIDMLSGNLIGQLLKMIIKASGAKRVLEIGTFTGYSALTMAEALPEDGEIITIELNLRYQQIAETHFLEFDENNKVKLIKGDARKLIAGLSGEFDLVFLDADKISYPLYFEKVIPKLKSGGFLLADNTLWGGTVLDPQDEKSAALDEFNKMAAEDKKVEQVLLPVRDGITVVRKK